MEGSSHRDKISVASGENLLGDAGRVDAIRCYERHIDLAPKLLRHPGKAAARHGRGDGRYTRLVPADAGVNDRRAGRLDRLREGDDLVPIRATVDEVEQWFDAHAVADVAPTNATLPEFTDVRELYDGALPAQ